tara:strand:+ start:221 stop:418 length:198 start_codon:yes stop_codon:yes gene_type:complete
MLEKDITRKKNSYSKHILGLHQLAAFEDYLLRVPETEIENHDLFVLNASLIGMQQISLELEGFEN